VTAVAWLLCRELLLVVLGALLHWAWVRTFARAPLPVTRRQIDHAARANRAQLPSARWIAPANVDFDAEDTR
jgi:hypothetical protein